MHGHVSLDVHHAAKNGTSSGHRLSWFCIFFEDLIFPCQFPEACAEVYFGGAWCPDFQVVTFYVHRMICLWNALRTRPN